VNRFENAARTIAGTSWLDNLARASLSAAQARFVPSPPAASLRVELLGSRRMKADESWQVTKALQEATAQIGRYMGNRGGDASTIRREAKEDAPLFQLSQSGNVMFFGFPEAQEAFPDIDHGERQYIATASERAASELVSVLPSTSLDEDALQAVLAQNDYIRTAVGRVVDAVDSRRPLDLRFITATGEETRSVLSTEQAGQLKEWLRETRTNRQTLRTTGRLDGVRTRRRLFYLELKDGREIQGAIAPELVADIHENLNRIVDVELMVEKVRTLAGHRKQPSYYLQAIFPRHEEPVLFDE
jgi:hypothetical protein